MMFNWLMAKWTTSFHKSDVKKILRNVVALPAEVQRSCAKRVLDEILVAMAELEKTPRRSDDLDQVIRKQLERAKEMRHQALRDGARDDSDPNWAAAALLESWLMANTGTMGRGTSDAIDGLIMGWLRSTLTTAEIEAAERRTADSKPC